jgi:hypothetical protein
MAVHDLPAADRLPMLRAAAREGITGGRIYDARIAEAARAAGADAVRQSAAFSLRTPLRHPRRDARRNSSRRSKENLGSERRCRGRPAEDDC